MKKIFLIFVSIICISTISCKEEKKEEVNNQPTVKENFSIELDVIASKKDDFTLYYTEDNTVNFDGNMAVWKGINGGNIQEKVIIDLSEEIIPTDIRLDFGINKEQEFVQINFVKIIYYGKEVTFKGSEFFNWFIKDDNFKAEIDAAKGTIKFVKNGDEYKTPFFYPRQELIDAIKNMTLSKS